MNYVAAQFTCKPYRPLGEILVARLAEIGFESFDEQEPKLNAYIPAPGFDADALSAVIDDLTALGEIAYTTKEIKDQNWNAEWEASYPPVVVDERAVIRAPFHQIDPGQFELDICINPQMSFGTGHHATTYLIMRFLLELDCRNLSVLDMGSGTGVLAIASAKLGAKEVVAVDNEAWAYQNTIENCALNQVHIEVRKDENVPGRKEGYDLILANINKNVLLHLLPRFREESKPGTVLAMSGFFTTDADEITRAAEASGFNRVEMKTRDDWAAIKFIY